MGSIPIQVFTGGDACCNVLLGAGRTGVDRIDIQFEQVLHFGGYDRPGNH